MRKMLFCYLIWSSFMIAIRDKICFLPQTIFDRTIMIVKVFIDGWSNFLSIAIFVIDSKKEKGGLESHSFVFQQSDINRHNLLNPYSRSFTPLTAHLSKIVTIQYRKYLWWHFYASVSFFFFLHAFFLSHTRTSMVKSRKSQLRDI